MGLITTPGFFGKLRSHGDFVSRRLPPAMLQPFDAWLQAGLVQSRADLGEAWLPTYGNSPLWRFVLAPGVCGPQAWAGVMMPSADRVGRCFPLTLAAGLDGTPALQDCLTVHAGWFAQLEDLALSTLDEGFVLEEFDAALQALGRVPTAAPVAGSAVALRERGVMPPLAPGSIDGCSAWWTDGAEQAAPCPGLPAATDFAALLNGSWRQA